MEQGVEVEGDKLTFSVGPQGDVTVKSWEDLERWISKERAHWAWLVRGDGKTDSQNWASEIQNAWNNLEGQASNLKAHGKDVSAMRGALEAFTSGLLRTAESADGATVLDIKETAGDRAGSYAYAFMVGQRPLTNARHPEELLGAILTAFPDMLSSIDITERLKRERANYRNAIRSGVERLDAARKDYDKSFSDSLKQGRTLAARSLIRTRRNWSQVRSRWAEQAAGAIADIRAVENAYREQMGLQAPVEYWISKAGEHKAKEREAFNRLLWFFPCAFIVLAIAFGASGWFLISRAIDPKLALPAAVIVIISAGLAVLSTLLFWVGRLLTKLYLSEHHLRNDADERAIMTKTYLALTNEEAASNEDRSIILNAIFRTTADGIVRDDGPGDIGLQAFLSKQMTK